jgi:beta-glucanase (GH16 family)
MIGTQKGSSIYKSKDEWHTFEINWEQDQIQFTVDRQIYYEFLRGGSADAWPFDQGFLIIMNIAVGGTWGGE